MIFSDIPQPSEKQIKIKPFLFETGKNYVETLGNKINPNTNIRKERSLWEPYIGYSIEFFVSMEEFDFLFTEIKLIFQKLDLNDFFIAHLEPFIIKNRIKHVPNEAFIEIASYFNNKNKSRVIEMLIINLDLEIIDIEFTIRLCLDYNLFKALIYICNHKDYDFITPLSKMFNLYLQKKDINDSNHKEIGHQSLWYIRTTLQGIMFRNIEIPSHVYSYVVKHFVIWIFIDENLKLLIEINPIISFPTFLNFFFGRANDIIKNAEEKLVIDLFQNN